MLKGHVFSEQTFDVKMFALFINQFLGGNNGIIESYKNAMAMTNTANSITIDTGAVVVQGRFLEEHTETTVNFAKTEALYCSLVLEIDLGQTNTATLLNQAQYKVLEDSRDYPTLIQNDIINQTGNIYQFELARFQNGVTGIVNFTDRRTYLRGDINLDTIYPIGSIYMSVNSTNPHDLFGGNWELLPDDCYLVNASASHQSGITYGENTHILTIGEMPEHIHSLRSVKDVQGSDSTNNSGEPKGVNGQGNNQGYTGYSDNVISSTGGGQAHNNQPFSMAVHIWRRIA